MNREEWREGWRMVRILHQQHRTMLMDWCRDNQISYTPRSILNEGSLLECASAAIASRWPAAYYLHSAKRTASPQEMLWKQFKWVNKGYMPHFPSSIWLRPFLLKRFPVLNLQHGYLNGYVAVTTGENNRIQYIAELYRFDPLDPQHWSQNVYVCSSHLRDSVLQATIDFVEIATADSVIGWGVSPYVIFNAAVYAIAPHFVKVSNAY